MNLLISVHLVKNFPAKASNVSNGGILSTPRSSLSEAGKFTTLESDLANCQFCE